MRRNFSSTFILNKKIDFYSVFGINATYIWYFKIVSNLTSWKKKGWNFICDMNQMQGCIGYHFISKVLQYALLWWRTYNHWNNTFAIFLINYGNFTVTTLLIPTFCVYLVVQILYHQVFWIWKFPVLSRLFY